MADFLGFRTYNSQIMANANAEETRIRFFKNSWIPPPRPRLAIKQNNAMR